MIDDVNELMMIDDIADFMTIDDVIRPSINPKERVKIGGRYVEVGKIIPRLMTAENLSAAERTYFTKLMVMDSRKNLTPSALAARNAKEAVELAAYLEEVVGVSKKRALAAAESWHLIGRSTIYKAAKKHHIFPGRKRKALKEKQRESKF